MVCARVEAILHPINSTSFVHSSRIVPPTSTLVDYPTCQFVGALKMSTQSARSILFTQRSPQQGFKLLELPPELAELLSSTEAPTYVSVEWTHLSMLLCCHHLTSCSQARTKIPLPFNLAKRRARRPGICQPLHTHANVPDTPSPILELDPHPATERRRGPARRYQYGRGGQ